MLVSGPSVHRVISPGPCADPDLALYYFKDPLIVDSCTGFAEARILPFTSVPGYWSHFSDFSPVVVGGLGDTGLPAVNPDVMSDPVAYLDSLYPGNVAYAHAPDSFAVRQQFPVQFPMLAAAACGTHGGDSLVARFPSAR